MTSELGERYNAVLARAKAAASGRVFSLIAVSKGQSVDQIEQLYRLGQRDFGENYAQELTEKARELSLRGCTELRWHFIGHLQTNKVKSLIGIVTTVHSVDSLRLAEEISKRASLAPVSIFLEVNIDLEPSKSGLAPLESRATAEAVSRLLGIELQGLMGIPEPGTDQGTRAFEALKVLELECQPYTRGSLSMGMSGDFEQALAAGATHIRVGTSIFGARQPKA